AGLLDPGRGVRAVLLLFREVGDRDIRTLARERDRDRAADAGVAARDEGAHPRALPRAGVTLLAVIGRRLGRPGEARLVLLLPRESIGVIPGPGVVLRGVRHPILLLVWCPPNGGGRLPAYDDRTPSCKGVQRSCQVAYRDVKAW